MTGKRGKNKSAKDDTESEKLDSLLQAHKNVTKDIQRIKKSIQDTKTSLDPFEVECRLEILNRYIDNGFNTQQELDRIDPDLVSRADLEALCISTKSLLLSKGKRVQSGMEKQANSTMIDSVSHSRQLPSIKLPRFSGEYSEYKNFIGVFTKLVDDDINMSNIEKFNHLLSCLDREALGTVKAYQVTDANYPKALAALKQVYDNDCLIVFENISKLFDLPKMQAPSASSLRTMIDSVRAIYESLLSLSSEKHISNAMLIHLVMSKVDSGTRAKWEENMDYSKLPLWGDCEIALNKRYQHLSAEETSSGRSGCRKSNTEVVRKGGKTSFAVSQPSLLLQPAPKCLFCKSDEHFIQACPSFEAIPCQKRFKFVKSFPLCINCLRKGHSVSTCKSSNCRVCSKPHNTLLHRYAPESTQTASSNQLLGPKTPASTQRSSVNLARNVSDQVILATAIVKIKDQCGSYQMARALLDSGSQVNFITEELANQLKLKREKREISLLGIGKCRSTVRHSVQTSIASRINSFEMTTDFGVLKSISSYQPENLVVNVGIPNNIELADPLFHKPQRIDLLLGADTFFDLLREGQIKGSKDSPTLKATAFGWIVSGRCRTNVSNGPCSTSLISAVNDSCSLDKLVRKFWELEEIPNESNPNLYTPEQLLCEKSFLDSITRLPSGRLSVSLPFKSSPRCLGSSFETAKRRFLALERRMSKQPEIQLMFIEFMKEYISLGHMNAIDNAVPSEPHYFIPYQCVLRPQSLTTKLRTVFDASSKTSSQLSLNEILMVGPTIQPQLYSTLLRFRLRPCAMTADISKMYRQIEIDETQHNFQLIVWRERPTDPLKIYRLNTVTYGTASAPFLAIRCLKYLSDLHVSTHPEAAKSLAYDFYVDDLLAGAETVEELRALHLELIEVLKSFGFELTKWSSNCEELGNQSLEDSVPIGHEEETKTLGLIWSPKDDVFKYSMKSLSLDVAPTKRSILSFVSRLYDPLGLLCPIITRAKILLQEMWIKGLGWDDPIPSQLKQDLEDVVNCFVEVDSIFIPRHVGVSKHCKVQIHGFADASTRAYGCCLYVRVETSHSVAVNLLTAKSKVAPLRTKSVPRLVLCAAQLLANLWKNVRQLLDFAVDKVVFWSDSEVVLHWLRMHASKLDTFVANRAADIQELTANTTWRHVPTKENPADIASRGCSTVELCNSFWFEGPDFLKLSQKDWPTNSHLALSKEQLSLETRKNAIVMIAADEDINVILKLIEDSSSYLKVLRIVSYMYRFINGNKTEHSSLVPTASELGFAFLAIVSIIQHIEFSDEIAKLKKSSNLQPSYQKLTPFLYPHHEGKKTLWLMRVGGRLLKAPLPHNAKFPLLMPKRCRFITLYLEYLHRTNCHANPFVLVGLLRQQIWLINAREACNAVVRKCVHCFRYKPILLSQIMGNLPADRLQGARPFEVSGVDFCGPIPVTLGIRGKSPVKMYIAVFVCFTSKAVHIELVTDLTSNTFIMCLSRFIGRRGLVKRLYCDNATNFVGAARMLAEFKDSFEINKDAISAFAATRGITFMFIPPRAPHFGGLWEAAVKSAKSLLLKSIGNAILRQDELETVLVEVEAILNSRPIIAPSSNPNDGEIVTPAHLLVGTTLVALPSALAQQVPDEKISYLKRWQLISGIKQRFWVDWSRDYLLSLQQRQKWNKDFKNVEIGTVVVIQEDNMPPQKWLTGVIEDTVAGADGKVRVAVVKTKSGIFKRAIHRLAALPIS